MRDLIFTKYKREGGRDRYSAKSVDGRWYEIAAPSDEFPGWIWWDWFGEMKTEDSFDDAVREVRAHDRARRAVKP